MDFAAYIVDNGGMSITNIFELAYEDQLYPYQYPMTKAYEMVSCFKGLLEYCRVTGIEKHKLSVIRFADKVLECDFTIVGSIETVSVKGVKVCFETVTEYPAKGNVTVTVNPEQSAAFTLLLRKPYWSKETTLKINGEAVDTLADKNGYMVLDRTWNAGDIIELVLDMRTRAKYPVFYDHDILMTNMAWSEDYAVPRYDKQDPAAMKPIALLRGPIVLAQENRLGYSADEDSIIL